MTSESKEDAITPDDVQAHDAAQARWLDDGGAVATPPFPAHTNALDRVIPIGAAGRWLTLGWVATLLVALALRLMRLDASALDAGEAMRAYDAWTLFRGQPLAAGSAAPLPNNGAALLLLEGFGFFLFGATDVVARLMPALVGVALVTLPLTMRRWLGDPAALGVAALLALSPTVVYASRVVSPEVIVATLALVAVASIVRLGLAAPAGNPRLPAIALGIAAGAASATAPSAISVALTLVIGLAIAALAAPGGIIRRGLRALRGRDAWFPGLLALALTTALAFTRFLSHPAGIAGVGETLGAWQQLIAGPGSGQPVPLYLMVLVIYELLAIAFAVVALTFSRRHGARGDALALLAGWAIAAFTLWSFSAGRGPEQAIHVALPIVLLAGIGLGAALRAIDWRGVWQGSGGVLALLMLGVVLGLGAVGVLLRRIGSLGGGLVEALPPVAVLCLVVVPLAYLIWRHDADARDAEDGGGPRQTLPIALLVLALLLGAFGLRSATLLAFYRADLGTEPLAQRVASLGVLPTVERFLRLSRDVGVADGSARDPTGSHGLSIAIEQGVEWPYVWYFREFPDLRLVAPGAAAASGAQVAIAAGDAGLAGAGYAVDSWPWLTTVPPQYLTPDIGAILGSVVNPARWLDGWRFLLFRDGVPIPAPATVAAGLTPELAGRVAPASGPFALSDRPGSGTEPGQFKDPIGVAVGPNGVIAVVDSGNARVQRFRPDGAFLEIWGDDEEGLALTRTENGLGPTGITVTADGITWVADTWGHRVVALDNEGQLMQSIGAETIDTGDDPARVNEGGGRFFGPRAVAVTNEAIYVVDTGNERVQRFALDGAFISAWGGYGSAPGQLIEPVGIAVGPDGNLYVADSGNARVAIFTPEGEPAGEWPVSVWPAPAPESIPPAYQPYLAFDAAGNLYATASNAALGFVIDDAGVLTERLTEAGGERLAQPVGVAVAPNGEILFTDVGRDAVLTVPPVAVPGFGANGEGSAASPRP